MAKIRFVAQGFHDKDKPFMVPNTSKLRSSSIRLILSAASIHKFLSFSHNVTQAYLQMKQKITRKIYIRIKKQDRESFGLEEDDLLKLNKQLYGLWDAGDYWGVTMNEHIIDDLGLVPAPGDPFLYVNRSGKKLDGFIGTYVINGLKDEMFRLRR